MDHDSPWPRKKDRHCFLLEIEIILVKLDSEVVLEVLSKYRVAWVAINEVLMIAQVIISGTN